MHFDILIEDKSGKKALEHLVPKIISAEHTFTVKAYKGIGKIPKNLGTASDPAKRILLAQLPKLLRGYGKTYAGYPDDYSATLILVCDLDDINVRLRSKANCLPFSVHASLNQTPVFVLPSKREKLGY